MANYVTNTSDKKKGTALVLCCLGFFGLGGLHYFYVGKYGEGFTYLFTVGWFGFGTAVDLFKIATGSFTDNVGVPLRA